MTGSVLNKFLPVRFTDRAIKEIRETIANKHIPENYSIRVGIRGGGCSGLSYMIGFDLEKESDDVFIQNELKVLVERKHTMYLVGVEIDFEDGLNARGFIFNGGLNQ